MPIIIFGNFYKNYARQQKQTQLKNIKETLYDFGQGVQRFIIGLGKKVILANNLGLIWSQVRFKIETENIKTFEKMWTTQGIAWFCEIADTTDIENTEFKIITAYYGSSSFNSKQMARLIDGVVQDCKPYGIETKPQAEIDSLLKEWDKK